jgi:hypothetical protein
MDTHPKDYVVPNFGVDHDLISTQKNFKAAGGKLALAEKESVPACNSLGCAKNTASPWKQRADPIDEAHNFPAPYATVRTSEAAFTKPAALAQSVPACNSHTHPGCKNALTSAPEHLAPLWKTDVELDEENLV